MNSHAHVLSTENLTKDLRMGDVVVHALRGVTLQVERGEFLGVIGPSGSGKSTLLGLIGGLDTPTSGKVFIDGTDITDLNERALTRIRNEKIGFVFQFFNLIPVLTAEENILLPLTIAGKRPDLLRMLELVRAVGIEDRLSHKPSELSGGQQQRVAVARALISRPAVLFADEPTGNLDSTSSEEVLGLLRAAVDDMGQTVVMVTHEPHAAAFADRLIVLKDGRVAHDGASGSEGEVIDLMRRTA